MNKNDKSVLIAYLIGTIYNLVNIGLFIALAIHFEKWYLVLISILFFKGYEIKTKNGEDKE